MTSKSSRRKQAIPSAAIPEDHLGDIKTACDALIAEATNALDEMGDLSTDYDFFAFQGFNKAASMRYLVNCHYAYKLAEDASYDAFEDNDGPLTFSREFIQSFYKDIRLMLNLKCHRGVNIEAILNESKSDKITKEARDMVFELKKRYNLVPSKEKIVDAQKQTTLGRVSATFPALGLAIRAANKTSSMVESETFPNWFVCPDSICLYSRIQPEFQDDYLELYMSMNNLMNRNNPKKIIKSLRIAAADVKTWSDTTQLSGQDYLSLWNSLGRSKARTDFLVPPGVQAPEVKLPDA